MNLSPLFSWRGAICDSDLPSTARHVALTLSLHMNERGGSCFPAVMTLVEETGLSERTIREMLKLLAGRGWLAKERRFREDGGETSSFYTATLPEGVVQQMQGGGAADTEPLVQEVQGGGAGDAPQEDVQVRTPVEDATSTSSPSPRKRGAVDEEYDNIFYPLCPKKVGKGQGRERWRKMTNTERAAAIEGMRRHAAWWVEHATDEQFIPAVSVWLNQRRWEDEEPRTRQTENVIRPGRLERLRALRQTETGTGT